MRRMPHEQSSDGVRGPRSQVNHRDESPRINRRDRACSGVIAFTYASSAAAPVDAAVRVAFCGRSDDDAARLFRGAVRSAASAHAMIAAASDAIPPPASSALAPDDEAPPSPPLHPPPPSSAPLPSAALVAASASRALEAKKTACRDHAEIFAEPGPRARTAGRPLAGNFGRDIRRDGACLRTDSRASSTVPAGPSAPGGCAGEARAARSAGTAAAAWVGEYWPGHLSGASRPVHVLTRARTTTITVHLATRGSHLGCISANSRLHDREHRAVHLAPRGV